MNLIPLFIILNVCSFHIIDVEASKQIGAFKCQIPTKDYGHMLVSVATEYNNALLVIENANIGWATIQVAIDKGYENLYIFISYCKFLHKSTDRGRTTTLNLSHIARPVFFRPKSIPNTLIHKSFVEKLI